MDKYTKIVCTLGPACENKKIIKKMVNAGMNVARLNFSHGDYKNHQLLIKNVRKAEKETIKPVAILQDLQGPKIRVGVLPEKGINLLEGKTVYFKVGGESYEKKLIPIIHPGLCEFINKNEKILLDDGRIEVMVTGVDIKKNIIKTKVLVDGILFSHKGVNLPDTKLSIGSLTEKDKNDARFGIKNGVDMMALSFVTDPKDVLDLRFFIKQVEEEFKIKSSNPIKIIAKIERREAVDRIDEILEVVDGVMIARGDLGLEIEVSEVPLVQKDIINSALLHAKPVIVATQMLDSMHDHPRPTRAEVSDVANAVIDHTDAVMLSNETATGRFPLLAVQTMSDIILRTEKSNYNDLTGEPNNKIHKIDDVISQLSRYVAEEVGVKVILAASLSGDTARLISRYRPEYPIVVATGTERVWRQLNLSWGVKPFILPECKSIEELVQRSVLYLKREKIIVSGDKIVIVAGEPVGHAGHVNLLEVREIK